MPYTRTRRPQHETSSSKRARWGSHKPAVSLVHRVKSSLPVRLITVLLVGEHFRVESDATQVIIYRHNSTLDRVSLTPIESVVAGKVSN